MNYSEKVAKVLIESLCPGTRMQFHGDQHDGPPDFDLCSANGIQGVVEVTESVDRTWLETHEAIKRKQTVPAVKCRKNWAVHVGAKVILKKTTAFDDALAMLEERGLDQYPPSRTVDLRTLEPVYQQMQALKIQVAFAVDPPDGKPTILFVSPGRGGIASYEAFDSAIDAEVTKADNLRKLSKGGHRERHLFILLSSRNILPWSLVVRSVPSKTISSARAGSSPPPGKPSIPAQVTHVWAAAVTDSGDEAVVWRVENGKGWDVLGKVAIPFQPPMR
jgi:hypothetical protein